MTEEKAEWHASQMVALDAGKFSAMQQELEQLRAERNGHAITLATQRKVAELQAENERLQKEMSAIRYAAHMPDDYQYGLPSWINQKLYMAYISRFDANGNLIPRTEDVEQIAGLRRTLHMVDDWLAATLPGSSSESIRALIAEALQAEKPA